MSARLHRDSVNDFGRVGWDRVNLDEWLAILAETEPWESTLPAMPRGVEADAGQIHQPRNPPGRFSSPSAHVHR